MILTRPQFEVLSLIKEGGELLEDHKGARIQFEVDRETVTVSSSTVRALYKRGLIELHGPLTDFPQRYKLTEKGEVELLNRKPPSEPPHRSKLKICPHYKAAILSGHDFARRLNKPAIDALAEAIQEYGRCDGVACEHAIVRRERGNDETQTIFKGCGRRADG